MKSTARLRSNAAPVYKVHPGAATAADDDANEHDDRLRHNKEFIEEETLLAISAIVKWWRLRRLHARIKSKWTPEQLRELHEAQRRKRVQARVRDILVYCAYLYIFWITTLASHKDASPYYFTRSLRGLFEDTLFTVRGSATPITFHDIRSTDHVHAWLQGPLLAGLYGNSTPTTGTVLGGTGQLVGAVSIGTLRVQRHDCTSALPAGVVADSSTYYCYGTTGAGLFSTDVESTSAFGSKNGSDFAYDHVASVASCRTKFFSTIASETSTATYPCPGFVQLLSHANASAASLSVSNLQAHGYVDAATRTLLVEINVANVMLRRIVVLRFLFEFPPSGGVLPSSNVLLAPYASASFDFETQWSVVLLGLFYAYFVMRLLYMGRRDGWQAFRSLAPWVDASNILCYIVMWLLRTTMGLDMPSTQLQSDAFSSFAPYATFSQLSDGFAAATAFLSFLRLLLLLDIIPHVALIVHVVVASVAEVSGFLLTFGLVVYAYATAFVLVFGNAAADFRTVPTAYSSLLRSLVGDINYAALSSANPVAAPLFLAAFTLSAVYVFLTILIAIMQDAYWKGKEKTDWDRVSLVFETVSYVWSMCNSMLRLLANWFGVRAALDAKAKTPKPQKGATAVATAAPSKRLSMVQTMVLKPLLSTQETLTRVGSQLTKNQLIKTSVQSLKKGSNVMTSAKGHLVAQLTSANMSLANMNQGSSENHLTYSQGAVNDEQIKALQGMIVQLAHQNTKIQHTLGQLQAQLADLRGDRPPSDGTSSIESQAETHLGAATTSL
ncbi:hypothetical protein SPRG_01926 [Saprolegnia parasitica CBS 223.65]|uniref:Uncharacterized protein n=1 Tax=Saprolegnia parasitica (strain CBS 223.65) TaxID=695850 RepID=A0A067CQY7_SAPPC|nr:hypothetical protein SPRG_01926 [Saprolegnia parasitica CBS 223.65]KDO33114.1 hypothetical protein SPRG_01926 [Saprolegnia parasitica CBS 223.65]|eukprot:XP_012195881.1 hypothetical protein SPRG_01926 [Saprolegnia parasitica CBS 223.65]